jgi:diguanylate cyclase (GGDEF)-like protein
VSDKKNSRRHRAIAAAAGVAAIFVTSLVGFSGLGVGEKIAFSFGIVMSYLAVLFSRRLEAPEPDDVRDQKELSDVPEKFRENFAALDEANRFFGSTLQPADMFRLVSSRVREIIGHSTAVLYFKDESGNGLNIIQADGMNAEAFRNFEGEISAGLAIDAFLSGSVAGESRLRADRSIFKAGELEGLRSSAAIPLFENGNVFGVLQLFMRGETKFDDAQIDLLGAVGGRVAPLFLSSFAFEKTLSNALTDSLTNLPNERAFHMVLENQLAESQRYMDERPLSIASLDLKGFAELNERYGHATGDRVLAFVAAEITALLRKMDFLARSINDEFLLIFPTANEDMVKEILERINRHFEEKEFDLTPDEDLIVELNQGWATFWKDGETGAELLRSAQLRKQQSKAMTPSKVLNFPKEYVN